MADRFESYLEYLGKRIGRSSDLRYSSIQFYMGHFYQQLANYSMQIETVPHCRERALCHYQSYLKLPTRQDESRYYALWQSAILQDMLKYPWCQVENSLLKAIEIDAIRGEAVKKAIEHYIRNGNWITAYSYSTIAVKKYFNKNPIALRRWFVDIDAYNWKVINTHLLICYKIGYLRGLRKPIAKCYEIVMPD